PKDHHIRQTTLVVHGTYSRLHTQDLATISSASINLYGGRRVKERTNSVKGARLQPPLSIFLILPNGTRHVQAEPRPTVQARTPFFADGSAPNGKGTANVHHATL